MQALMMLAGLVVAMLGQWLNAHPDVPTPLVKLALAVAGMALYAIADAPDAMTREAFLSWLDSAWLWALALPGAASLIGLAPGMQTKNP